MKSVDAYATLLAGGHTGPTTIAEIAGALGISNAQASATAKGLIVMEMATRLRRGLILLKEPTEIGTPALGADAHRSAMALVDSEESYIGFYTALHHHALVVRPVATVFVATTARRRSRVIGGTAIRFVTVIKDRLYGIEPGDNQLRWSDPERTLVDGLARPEYCGQMDVVVGAFHRHGPRLSVDRLRDHIVTYGAAVVAKRAEYVMERLGISDGQGAPQLARGRQRHRFLLDPHGSAIGEYNPRWEIVDNTPERAWHGG